MSNFSFDAFSLLGDIDWSLVDFNPGYSVTSNSQPVREVSDVRGTNGPFRMSTVRNGDATGVDMTFVFPFLPTQMQVSDLGDSYAEISRPKLIPIVEFSSHKLMKFQIEFLVSLPGDGIKQTIDAQIEFLRRMATSKQGIVFSNGSGLLMNPLYYAGVLNTSNMFFYITDMGVNVQRFLPDNSGVAAASVSMSFTEVRNPVQRVVKLPKIDYKATPPKKKAGGKGGAAGGGTRYSETQKVIIENAKAAALAAASVAGSRGRAATDRTAAKAPKIVVPRGARRDY